MILDKLSTHMIYILSQERNWIWSTTTGSLSLCLYLGIRILKRINLRFKEVLFNLCIVLVGLCQGGGIIVLQYETEFPIKCIYVKNMNNCICRAYIYKDLTIRPVKPLVKFAHCLILLIIYIIELSHKHYVVFLHCPSIIE
jgi:hypothetical protein